MTEPRRLLDDASGIERQVLESATLDDPTPHRRRRVAAAVVGAGAASLTTSSAVAAGGKVAATWATWKVVVGIAAVTAAVSVSVAKSRPVQPVAATPSASVTVVAAAPKVLVEEPPRVLVAPAPAASSAPTAAPAVAPKVAVAPSSIEPEAETGPTLASETALLDQARAAIAAGSGAKALAALDRYQTECKGGALALESQVLRVEAIAATGDRTRASALARAFLDAHPGSAYETRIQKHVVDAIQ